MAVYTGTFSGRSAFQLHLHLNPGTPNQSGNYTPVNWALYIVETGSYGSWSYDAATWSVTVAGQTWSGSTPYDFRGAGNQSLLVASGTKNVSHDANGYGSVSGSGAVGGNTPIGSSNASGSFGLARIPKVPGAPLSSGSIGGTVLGVDQITTTSLRFRFSGTTDGGSTITGWEIQYADNPSFTGAWTTSSSGTTTIGQLKPGTTYYLRARGKNAVGWGPYSAVQSGKTLAAMYVSDGTTWRSAEVYVSTGTSWALVELFISDGDSWEAPVA